MESTLKPDQGVTEPRKKSWWKLVKETFRQWNEDKVPKHGAALAFYAVFSLAPVLVMAVMMAGMFFGREMAQKQVNVEMQQYLGQQGAQAVQRMMHAALGSGPGRLAWVGSILVLLFGATGAFVELQDSLNTIWRAPVKSQGIWATIRAQALSFLMVLGIGVLLVVLLALNSAVQSLSATLSAKVDLPHWTVQTISFATSFLVITVLFAAVFKVLPAVEIRWKDVWVGAVATALLFALGMYLFGLYVSHSAMSGSAYGAVGSVLIVLLWAYYSAQILLLGAEFTQVYTRMYGAR
jgi:membrane protein